ncbi:class I SAM-dependent methyltransferase [Rhodosalinus sp. K401]|uniref:class I SAM-dependent DNA methyltransferase n=1 Tax=Rhodosalinus sp. K401 TaxID=3239195 RepID=UPI00352320EF
MPEKFLDKVYDVSGMEETRALYDNWAASYDTELGSAGYATPARTAKALAAHMGDRSAPVLDFGCGTGLSGAALRAAGLTTIDGVDVSDEMLAEAQEKGAYRCLDRIGFDDDLSDRRGRYAAVAAIGVIGAGAAPLAVFDRLMALLEPGGLFAFSFNDHTLENRSYEAHVSEWTDTGAARLLVSDYGPHLPARDLNSRVYVLERK